MRITAILLIAATIIVSLTSCSGYNHGNDAERTENTSSLTYPPSSTSAPNINIFYESITQVELGDIGIYPSASSYTVTDSDGNPLMYVSITVPNISYVNNESAKDAVSDCLKPIHNQIQAEIDSLISNYLADFSSGYDFFSIPSYYVTYTITGFSQNKLSLLYSITHSNADGIISYSTKTNVIDLKGFFTIDLSTLFTGSLSDKLLTLINRKLASNGCSLYDDYENIAAQTISSCWLISGNDICFVFDPYVIAPASEGVINITLYSYEIGELVNEYGAEILGATGTYNPEVDD